MSIIPQSLRGRLLVSLLVPLLGIGLVALINSNQEAESIAATVADRVLAGSALAIAERIVVTEAGDLDVEIPYAALEMLTSAAQDKVFYRVDGPPGSVITGYEDLPTADVPEGAELQFADALYNGDRIRIAVLRRAASSGIAAIPFQVIVAETTLARQQLAQSILVNSALRLGLLIAAAVAIALASVSLSIRPLYRLGQSIARRSPSEMSPIVEKVPTEVRTLVATINSFMSRLGASLGALRSFTGNASHQLRTPLTVVRAQLAFAMRARTLNEAHAAAAEADGAVVRAERVLAQLMVLAQIDEVSSHNHRSVGLMDLVEVARSHTADAIPAAAQASIDLGFDGSGAIQVEADPILVGELLHNLIDNAVKYAGTGAAVTVRVRKDGDRALLEVEDTGPGIAPESHDEIRRRFHRERFDKPGSGLGIAIVDEIVSLYGGRLVLGTGAGGKGLRVTIDLPLATAQSATRASPSVLPGQSARTP